MKKIIRILSVALVAVMVLSLSAVALADTPSVYIPKRLAKLGSFFFEDYAYPKLSINVTALAGTGVLSTTCKDKYTGEYVENVSITEDSVAQFQFSEKPDWFGATASKLDFAGGWVDIELDESGYGELEIGELHRQVPKYGTYQAGKDYGDYSVTVYYNNDGSAAAVIVSLKDSEDFFRTNQTGGVMSITFEKVTVLTKCGENDKYHHYDTFWFVSGVSAEYPAGNYIAGVETEWRNDSKQNLATYRIAYAVNEKETYKITYAPNTTTVAETHTYKANGKTASIKYQDAAEFVEEKTGIDLGNCADYLPSENLGNGEFLHHYTADEPIYGEYYRNGSKTAITGSGNKLGKWYKPGHGSQVKGVTKSIYSFKSPRVY